MSLISDDLSALLRAGTADFWAALESDASLRACLDSYLQHSRFAQLHVKLHIISGYTEQACPLTHASVFARCLPISPSERWMVWCCGGTPPLCSQGLRYMPTAILIFMQAPLRKPTAEQRGLRCAAAPAPPRSPRAAAHVRCIFRAHLHICCQRSVAAWRWLRPFCLCWTATRHVIMLLNLRELDLADAPPYSAVAASTESGCYDLTRCSCRCLQCPDSD